MAMGKQKKKIEYRTAKRNSKKGAVSFHSRTRPKKSEQFVPIAKIKVIGVGGGGGNAVGRISKDFVRGVEFIAINTDHQDLDYCNVRHRIYIGKNLTRGLGTGMNPELGERAAEENRSEIAEAVRGADLVFITAGFGGGTGGGAAPVVAEVAKQSGALTFAVVTKPFAFEGAQRERNAAEALSKIKEKVDALIVVPNDRVFGLIGKDTPILKAFEVIDDILRNALKGIVELIVSPGIINVDFADIRAVVQDAGSAIISTAIASGQDRAVNAVTSAINPPLLEIGAEGARGVVLGIAGGKDLTMAEINEAAKLVAQSADPSARIIFGAYRDRNLKPNQIKITLIATGFNGMQAPNSLFTRDRFNDRPAGFFGGMHVPPRDDKEEEKQLRENTKNAGSFSAEPSSKKKADKDERTGNGNGNGNDDTSYPWDIPTFLRKKRK